MITKRKKSRAMKTLEKLAGGPLSMGALLESIRLGEDVSQAAFSRKLGISRSNLCDIEKGRRFIGPDLASKFARRLSESEEQFIRIAIQGQLSRLDLQFRVEVMAA